MNERNLQCWQSAIPGLPVAAGPYSVSILSLHVLELRQGTYCCLPHMVPYCRHTQNFLIVEDVAYLTSVVPVSYLGPPNSCI